MYYFRAIIFSVVMLAAAASRADDSTPAKVFIPLSASHHAVGGMASSPQFFALKARSMGKILPHPADAAAQEETTIPHDHPQAEAMTQEQAQQILSIFSNAE